MSALFFSFLWDLALNTEDTEEALQEAVGAAWVPALGSRDQGTEESNDSAWARLVAGCSAARQLIKLHTTNQCPQLTS